MSPDPSLTVTINPPPNGAAVREKIPTAELEQLEQLFADTRGVDLPDWESDPKGAQKLWRTPLKTIRLQCQTLEETKGVILATIQKMNGLTYTEPMQILKTAKSLLADRKQKVKPGGNDDRYQDVY